MDGNLDPHAPAGIAAVTANHDPAAEAPISRLVAELVAQCPGERITIAEMSEVFGERAFGMLILMLCLPGLLPGMASVFGTPILILGVQMGLGMRRPVFPGFISRKVRRESSRTGTVASQFRGIRRFGVSGRSGSAT